MVKSYKAMTSLMLLAVRRMLSVIGLMVSCFSSLVMAETHHYMIDDDNLGESYWSSSLPTESLTLYKAPLPNFFGHGPEEPEITFSIQHMTEATTPILTDDEKQSVIKLFDGDPLERKALVIEVPLD